MLGQTGGGEKKERMFCTSQPGVCVCVHVHTQVMKDISNLTQGVK